MNSSQQVLIIPLGDKSWDVSPSKVKSFSFVSQRTSKPMVSLKKYVNFLMIDASKIKIFEH